MLVCLEGIDGSGKATQSQLLHDALRERYGAGRVVSLSFPRYGQSFFAAEVAAYLNGDRGTLEQVDPRFASMLFAGDRFEAKPEIEEALRHRKIIICDRYVASNIAHQGARLPAAQRADFYTWNEHLEYQIYGLPRADLTFFIDTPPALAWELVARKAARDYTAKQRDIQEAKADYLHEVYKVYRELAADGGWKIIISSTDGQLRERHQIADEILRTTIAAIESTTILK